MSVSRAAMIAEAARALAAAGIEDAPRDARLLARWAAGLSAAALSARLDEIPQAEEAARFADGLSRRLDRRPLSHIAGVREFWGRLFAVGPQVLDPRPETEILIAAALEGPAPARILDLGLGSGCILLTLLAERPAAQGVGVERSAEALAVARSNAEGLGLSDRAELRLGDWYAGLAGRFDLVVSNPPYIREADHPTLQPEVRLWEPKAALTAGADGLDAYRALAAGLAAVLAPGGRALFEIGAGQETEVARIFAERGFAMTRAHEDFDGRPRCLEFASPPRRA